jgi:hypothetical protein
MEQVASRFTFNGLHGVEDKTLQTGINVGVGVLV